MDKQFYIQILSDLSDAIKITKNKIYIFGGFTLDIWQNDILRSHHDVDTICIDFWKRSKEIALFFEERGYKITYVPNGDLKIKINNFGISMTNCEVSGDIAIWSPDGVEGSIYFPIDWLDKTPHLFKNIEVYTVDKRFEYCLKNNPASFNASWILREKDAGALRYLKNQLDIQNTTTDSFINKMYRR